MGTIYIFGHMICTYIIYNINYIHILYINKYICIILGHMVHILPM